MDRHIRSQSFRCDYYGNDAYYEDINANNFDDGYKHPYSYYKTRLYKPPQYHRENCYYDDDDAYLPSYPSYYRYSYRTREELYIPRFLEEEHPIPELVDEYTRSVGWFCEHLISRTGRVVRANTVRLWSGLRRTATSDGRERRGNGRRL